MKLAVVLVACAACASDPDVTEPILASDPSTLEFRIPGTFDYQIDAHAQTISGSRAAWSEDGTRYRMTLAQPVPADPQLAAILDATFVTTLGDDSCKKLHAGCGDPSGYLAVTIDGDQLFTSHEDCHHLSSQYDLEVALGDIFDAAGPVSDTIDQRPLPETTGNAALGPPSY